MDAQERNSWIVILWIFSIFVAWAAGDKNPIGLVLFPSLLAALLVVWLVRLIMTRNRR